MKPTGYAGPEPRPGATDDRWCALDTGQRSPGDRVGGSRKVWVGIMQTRRQGWREVAGMNAFFILSTNWRAQVGGLSMDHPPIEKRLAALAELSREMGKPVS